MSDRKCPNCKGKAVVTVFINEMGQFAKLWKCQRCLAVWGVPTWDYVAHDISADFGLEPWNEDSEPNRSPTFKQSLRSVFRVFHFSSKGRVAQIAIVVGGVAGCLLAASLVLGLLKSWIRA
jgi:hypothetical protein